MDNYDINPYNVFSLPNNFTIDMLQNKYKELIIKMHPDNMGGNKEFLLIIKKCYKLLLTDYENRNKTKLSINNSFKNSNNNSIITNNPSYTNNSSFNIDKFNEIFDKTKLKNNIADKGYDTWIKQSKLPKQPTINKYNKDEFHRLFEQQDFIDKNNKYIVKHIEPQPQAPLTCIDYTELGIDNINDYSGENRDRNGLQFTDYKLAHTISRLVDPNTVNREEFRDINDLEKERSRLSNNLSLEEKQNILRNQEIENLKEQKRIKMIKNKDRIIEAQHYKIKKLLEALRR